MSFLFHTGNLIRLKLSVLFDTPLGSIAIANPLLRGVKIGFYRFPNCDHQPQHDEVERWITRTVEDFIKNCSQIEDIVVDEDIVIDDKEDLLHCRRITALDALRLSSNARRKIGVRVGSLFYDF